MRIVHLINRTPYQEAVVLSSEAEAEINATYSGEWDETNIYNVADVVSEYGEWPSELPLDRELTQ